MTETSVIGFAVAAFFFNLSPGPSVLFVLSRGIAGGKRAGMLTAAGLGIGSALWAVLTALGFSLVLRESEFVFGALRVCGAVYLVWLAVQTLRSEPFDPDLMTVVGPRRWWRYLLEGFLVETTNPKTVMFFLALVTQVATQLGGQHSLSTTILFCLIVPLTALPIDVTIGLSGGALSSAISKRPRLARALCIISSAILFGLAGLAIAGLFIDR